MVRGIKGVTGAITGGEFDELFTRARQALEQVRRTGASGDAAPEPEPVTAESADGQVRVVMTPYGELSELTVAPKLLRQGLEEVCAHIIIAVNAAIAELRSRPAPLGAVDPAALAATLRELQTDSVRRMAVFGSVVDDVVARLIRAGQRS